jgi:hypothetical protein
MTLRDFEKACEGSLKERGVWGIKAKPFNFGRRIKRSGKQETV